MAHLAQLAQRLPGVGTSTRLAGRGALSRRLHLGAKGRDLLWSWASASWVERRKLRGTRVVRAEAASGTYSLQLAAGWSSLVARRAHNPKVVGSNPTPATKKALVTAPAGPGLRAVGRRGCTTDVPTLDASAQIICDRRAWPDGRRCGQASVPGPSLREGLRIWSVAEPVWARAPGSVRSAPPEAHATTAPNGRGVATCTGRDPRSSRPGAWSPRHPLTCLLCSFWPATAWRGCRREAQPVAHPLAAAGRGLHDDQHVHAVASARSTGRPARCHSGKRFSSPRDNRIRGAGFI